MDPGQYEGLPAGLADHSYELVVRPSEINRDLALPPAAELEAAVRVIPGHRDVAAALRSDSSRSQQAAARLERGSHGKIRREDSVVSERRVEVPVGLIARDDSRLRVHQVR